MKMIAGLFCFFFFSSCTQDDTIRFALFSDTHVAENTSGAADLRLAVADVNRLPDLDFVLISGDITDMNIGNNLKIARQILDSLNIPYHIVPGNHDTKWSGSAGANFRTIWPDDKFVFDAGKYRFIGFHQGPVLRMDDGHIPGEDLDWLKDTLQKTGREKEVILVMHYPLTSSIDNWSACADIIRGYNIKAIIHGHGHRSRFREYLGIPGIMGRSTLRASEERGGFNVFELRNDSVFVTERITGSDEQRPWLSHDLSAAGNVQQVPDSLLPDYSVNQKYPQVKIKWLFESGYTTTASPVVSGERVFIADVSGQMHVLDLTAGLELWSFPAAGSVYGTAAVAENRLVFNAADSAIYCVDISNQTLVWKYATNNELVAVPVIHDGVVYSGASDGIFRAVSLADGKLQWQFDQVGSYVETRPLIYQDKVIFGAWDGYLYALNLADGSLAWKWHGDRIAPLYSPAACWPVAAAGKVFVAAPDRFLSAINIQNGATLWRNNDWKFRETVGLSADGKTVFARSMTDSVVAVKTQSNDFDLLWQGDFRYGYDIAPSMPVEKDGTVFWATKNGLITAANAATGDIIWQHKFEDYLINTVQPVNDKQLVFSNIDGKTARIGVP